MYPTLYHALLDLTGLDLPFLKFLNSFGFFVAIAFFGAHITLAWELKRKEGLGLLRPVQRTITVGEAAKPIELIIQGLIGFVVGWKGLYLLLRSADATADPPAFLLSGKGNFFGGLVVGALFTWLYWREQQKHRLKEPEQRQVTVHPFQQTGSITLTAALWGFIGAKLFHWLESPRDLLDLIKTHNVKDIITGLTMYGGLIVAGIMVIRFFRKNDMAVLPSMDAAAPGLMLAYGIGRLGCQVSGDGDWGIAHTAPTPGWIPNWLWSYDYPNNVNGVGRPILEGSCFEGYCTHLVPSVYPTPLYEVLACLLLFGVLWSLRKHISVPGVLFAVYLMFNGIERFLIEKIRVNVEFLGSWTQAEVISTGLFLTGIGMWWWATKRNAHGPGEAHG